jgi:hypothetical protein
MMKAITKYGQRAAVVTKAHALWLSVHKIRTYKDRKVLPDRFTCFKVQTSTLTTTSHQILKSHVNQELQHKRSNHDAQLIEARKQSLRPGGLKSSGGAGGWPIEGGTLGSQWIQHMPSSPCAA